MDIKCIIDCISIEVFMYYKINSTYYINIQFETIEYYIYSEFI